MPSGRPAPVQPRAEPKPAGPPLADHRREDDPCRPPSRAWCSQSPRPVRRSSWSPPSGQSRVRPPGVSLPGARAAAPAPRAGASTATGPSAARGGAPRSRSRRPRARRPDPAPRRCHANRRHHQGPRHVDVGVRAAGPPRRAAGGPRRRRARATDREPAKRSPGRAIEIRRLAPGAHRGSHDAGTRGSGRRASRPRADATGQARSRSRRACSVRSNQCRQMRCAVRPHASVRRGDHPWRAAIRRVPATWKSAGRSRPRNVVPVASHAASSTPTSVQVAGSQRGPRAGAPIGARGRRARSPGPGARRAAPRRRARPAGPDGSADRVPHHGRRPVRGRDQLGERRPVEERRETVEGRGHALRRVGVVRRGSVRRDREAAADSSVSARVRRASGHGPRSHAQRVWSIALELADSSRFANRRPPHPRRQARQSRG